MNNRIMNDTALFKNPTEENLLTNRDATQLLFYLQDQGMINVGDVTNQMRRKEKEERLKKIHPYAITECGGRWQTYVHDESRPNNRRKITRIEKSDLIDSVLEFYGMEIEEEIKEKWTLETLYPKWKEYKALHSSETTMVRIDGTWRSYYEGTDIVKVPIVKFTKLQLDEWVHRLIQKYHFTKVEYYNMTIIIRQSLDYAVELDIVNENVFRKVHVNGRRMFRRVNKKRGDTQVFSEDEVKRVSAMAMEDYYSNTRLTYELAPLAVIFAFKTGQRPSEVCANRYEDIEGFKLHVQRMFQRDTGKVIDSFKGTFDAFDDRYIYLTPEAMQIIELCKRRQKERGVLPNGYIFSLTGEADMGLYRAVSNRFKVYSQKLGGPMRSPTKSRKTFISTALDADINPDTVRRIVGHRDIQTTLNNYYFDRAGEEERMRQFTEAFDLGALKESS